MRLHLGAGDKYWPGWVNVDSYGDQDELCDCKSLPFEDETVSEIQCIHMVEHIPRMEVNGMIQDWFRVLKSGGKLVIEVPCLDKMAQMIVDGEKNIRLTLLGIFGDPRDPKPAMMHKWAYTKAELKDLLLETGFVDVEVSEPVYHVARRDMRITAVKP